MIRVVVDTNVLISALLKAGSGPARIVTLWQAGELALIVSPETIDEVDASPRVWKDTQASHNE